MSETTPETPVAAPAASAAPAAPVETAPASTAPEDTAPGLAAPTPETSAAVAADPDSADETPQEGAQSDSESSTTEETDETPIPSGGSSSSTTTSTGDNASPEGSESTSEDADSQEASGDNTPADPQVVNDDSGQHVVLPDGTKVYTRHDAFPRSNAEQATFELTHSGDQLRYPYKPGDKEYNAYSDPAVPNSHLARMVETEIVSYAERVLDDPNAAVSTMWNALKGVFDGQLAHAIETGEGSGKIVEV
jgi:hypothetical protein